MALKNTNCLKLPWILRFVAFLDIGSPVSVTPSDYDLLDHVTKLSYLAARPSLALRTLHVFIYLFIFFARPTDPPSREGGRWETKQFIGMALSKVPIFTGAVIHCGQFNICISSLNPSPTLSTPETEIKLTKGHTRLKVLDSDSE